MQDTSTEDAETIQMSKFGSDDYNEYMNDNAARSQLELSEKNIEPDIKINPYAVSRNNQLGYISIRQFYDVLDLNSLAEIYEDVPYQMGGYLMKEYANKSRRQNDFMLVTSLSVGAKLRELLQTLKRQHEHVVNKGKKSFFKN